MFFFLDKKEPKNQDCFHFFTLRMLQKTKLHKLARFHQGSNRMEYFTLFEAYSTKMKKVGNRSKTTFINFQFVEL
jgi:arginyl-tRNA--protein-N-Asp/Glu arginylyltransferase